MYVSYQEWKESIVHMFKFYVYTSTTSYVGVKKICKVYCISIYEIIKNDGN